MYRDDWCWLATRTALAVVIAILVYVLSLVLPACDLGPSLECGDLRVDVSVEQVPTPTTTPTVSWYPYP